MQIAADPFFHEKTKYNIDCHFIREKVLQGLVETGYLSYVDHPADILTKGLSSFQYDHLLSNLKNIFIRPSLKGGSVEE